MRDPYYGYYEPYGLRTFFIGLVGVFVVGGLIFSALLFAMELGHPTYEAFSKECLEKGGGPHKWDSENFDCIKGGSVIMRVQ